MWPTTGYRRFARRNSNSTPSVERAKSLVSCRPEPGIRGQSNCICEAPRPECVPRVVVSEKAEFAGIAEDTGFSVRQRKLGQIRFFSASSPASVDSEVKWNVAAARAFPVSLQQPSCRQLRFACRRTHSASDEGSQGGTMSFSQASSLREMVTRFACQADWPHLDNSTLTRILRRNAQWERVQPHLSTRPADPRGQVVFPASEMRQPRQPSGPKPGHP